MQSLNFPSYFKHFAQSSDIFSEQNFENIYDNLLFKYLDTHYQIDVIALLQRAVVGNQLGLSSFYSKKRQLWSEPLKKSDDSYHGQLSFAFGERKALWVTRKDKNPLNTPVQDGEDKSNIYTDSWSGCTNIPIYETHMTLNMMTAIYVPLYVQESSNSEPLGVLVFESRELLEYNEGARKDFEQIAQALAILYTLQATYTVQRYNTSEAIEQLRDAITIPPIGKVIELFIATSGNIDDDVLEAMREILDNDEQMGFLVPCYWFEEHESGSITEQLFLKLRGCIGGICVFSEPSTAEQFDYEDNSNVLIEAGFMHALKHDRTVPFSNWIIIREAHNATRTENGKDIERTSQPPFDFRDQRMIIIPRYNSGKRKGQLNSNEFKKQLTRHIKATFMTI